MSLFRRKKPAQTTVTAREIQKAADQLNAGDNHLSDQLCEQARTVGGRAGEQRMAMAILGASIQFD
ncbi:hypothetical protein [Streptomyces sp. 8L]|uniref:hypothetical protein n=1 Tax=Streptomyces sp. 8L TaxID=2877242 RepID=UPI001CD75D18|nr:hypothetical protein [Streptomyces sp. 8L]MCA1223170.1 hypothetical protein [Streptomyces sp. 8L]